jgi:ubiquinone/menaquinone biosynthesis C-methylase UbiE
MLGVLRWLALQGKNTPAHRIALKMIATSEKYMIAIETRDGLTGVGTISSAYHTVEANRRIWNNYDWADYGEEWTRDVAQLRGISPSQWKAHLIKNTIYKYFKSGSTILEIGPGAGRWTEVLQTIAQKLIIADISEKCLKICRERFQNCSNIEYRLIGEQGLNFIDDNSIDYVWSYDVFVHINPTDTEKYLIDLQRILKPEGIAVIHHPGSYVDESEARQSFRSYVNEMLFAHLVTKYGMAMAEQNGELPHMPGDFISIVRKPFPRG